MTKSVAIHQPHYFPWEGYLRKMASVDQFILMDEVQLTDSSPMYRHALLTVKGEKKYITIPFNKNEYKHKAYKDILLNDKIDWQKNHRNFLHENYGKSPFYDEVINSIIPIFNKQYRYLCDVTIDSVFLLKELMNINTTVLLQSELDYPKDSHKNDLVLELCKAASANHYLSGRGARKYMELTPFEKAGITVSFQEFEQKPYKQHYAHDFIGGLSLLDMMFNLGCSETKKRLCQQ